MLSEYVEPNWFWPPSSACVPQVDVPAPDQPTVPDENSSFVTPTMTHFDGEGVTLVVLVTEADAEAVTDSLAVTLADAVAVNELDDDMEADDVEDSDTEGVGERVTDGETEIVAEAVNEMDSVAVVLTDDVLDSDVD